MSQRPFKVLGVQQIAIGGPDKVRLQKLWVDMFGLEVTGTFRSERENVDEDICAMGSGPFKVEVDLMQPLDPEKKPAVHTTPLNHIGLWIDKLPQAVQWLTEQAQRPGQLLHLRNRAAQLSGLVQAGRPVHANGRYYENNEDLVRSDKKFNHNPDDGEVDYTPPVADPGLFPLSNNNDAEQRFNETEQRFRRMANSITVRSDVFEIVATVQSGYCIDTNGDGRLNYRSPDEFVTTAETQTRVIYERRAPSDTSDRPAGGP